MNIRTAITVLSILSLGSTAMAQGLLSIGKLEVDEKQELQTTVGFGGGFDSTDFGAGEDAESAFVTGGLGVSNGWGSGVSRYHAGAQGNVVYYFDDAGRSDDTFYNGRVHLDMIHEISRRLKIGANLYGAYEFEPDYAVGASSGRIDDQYFYGYAHTDLAYQWTSRFSTVSGYTFSAVVYDDDVVANTEDRMSHVFSQEFRYAFSRRTSGIGEYRYKITDYDVSDADYRSHFALAGVEHAWSETSSVTAKAGAEFRDSDRSGDSTRPYAELAVHHRLSRTTGIRWYNRVGLDDSDLGIYRDRYSYRTGIIASTDISDRLSAHGGLHYVYSDLDGTDDIAGVKEHQGSVSVGLTYSLGEIWALTGNYSFTTIASDEDFRDYERHRVTVGATATF